MRENTLRHFIRLLLEKEVLGEPDLSSEDEREHEDEDEQSVSGAVAGVTTPLGTGPTYPNQPRGKKKMTPAQAAGSAFGNAKPIKKA